MKTDVIEVLSPKQPRMEAFADPTRNDERVTSLDVLRGFALLGILLMNIVGFGLYYQAYNNPLAAGGASGPNLWVWAILSVLAEGKMRCLFTLVFGASVVLLTNRLERRPDAADLYYRRLLWLLAFGIAHAYLLWDGEVLYYYALCALALYPFRKLSAKALVGIAAICILATASAGWINGTMKRADMQAGKAAIEKAERNEALTDDEKKAKDDWVKFLEDRNPTPEALQKDAEKWRGNFISVIKARAAVVMQWHWYPYYHAWNFDLFGMMFLGMALFKMGVLSAERSTRFYLALAGVSYAIGLPTGVYKTWIYMESNFDPVVEAYTGILYDIHRLSITLGHLALLLILFKTGCLRGLLQRLAAVGQMAFTNYIMHSIICAFLFTGYGLGWYNRLERYELYYVVAAIWILQLIVSPIWLRHFRFGPLEWAWRSLTYWKRPPFRQGIRRPLGYSP